MKNTTPVLPPTPSFGSPATGADAVPIWRLRAIAYTMILVSVFAVGMKIHRDYDENIQYQTKILHQLGRSAADRIGHKITLIDSHLREILADLPPAALATPDALRVAGGTRETHELLRRRRYDLNSLDAFGLMDADGYLLNTSRFFPLPSPPPARAGKFYQRIRNFAEDEPVIGDVTNSIITGRPTFLMARRIWGAGRVFLGSVVAAIDVGTCATASMSSWPTTVTRFR